MEEDKKEKCLRAQILNRGAYDPKTYEYDDRFKPWDGKDPLGVHSTHEMLECLAKNPKVVLDAKVLHFRQYKDGRKGLVSESVGKKSFMESFAKDVGRGIKTAKGGGKTLEFKEGSFGSGFGGYSDGDGLGGSLVGNDFTPLLGGPFYKNLYFYTDYIKMHAEAFYSYHNDPFAKASVEITKNFVLGTGYEVQTDTSTQMGKVAMAAWRAFEQANDLKLQIDQICDEIGIYGEIMIWELPGDNTKITYRLGPTDTRPIGIIPRVRLIDPSNIVEIVTYPEDITRPLMYVWLQPTQYQIYTSGLNSTNQSKLTNIQPTLKFIYRQIPADQMMHFKINSVSNEKRGRSDFFPVFNYLKRLRDAVNYQMISLEKVSAWAIDTTVEGDQTDIDDYISSQQALGTIPTAGSEFVHSKGIQRAYIGNKEASAHSSDILQWCLSAIAAGYGVPVSWYGTHLSGGSTRASALVATEPVTKRMEHRRIVISRILQKLFDLCMLRAGLPRIDCDIVFPELITQDRSQKLKDLQLAEQMRWLSPKRVATMAAKEFQAQKYDYETELKDMVSEIPEIPMPLVDPGGISPQNGVIPVNQEPTPGGGSGGGLDSGGKLAVSGITSQDKVAVRKQDTTL